MSYYYSKPSIFNHLLDYPKYSSIYDSPWAYERITSPGYKYEPISRYIYGTSTPRKIYPYDYDYSYYWPKYDYFKGQLEWDNHQKRMAELDTYYPLKYINPRTYRPRYDYRASSLPPVVTRTYYPLYNYRTRSYTPGPVAPSEKATRFSYIPSWTSYIRGGYTRRPLIDLLNPSTALERSRITRDPWWWEYPELRPYRNPYLWGTRVPSYYRTSYLSPVKRSYIWTNHPFRNSFYSYAWI